MDESYIANLSPEELKQLFGMSTLDERGNVIQDQMRQAMALRDPISGQHSTGMGAALGGLGDVFRGIGGGVAERGLRADQQENLGKKDAGNQLYGKIWQMMLRGQTPPVAPVQVPNSPLQGQEDQPFSYQATQAPFSFGGR